MKILLFGCTGQMGKALARELGVAHRVIPLSHDDADIGDFKKVKSLLRAHHPDVVINTAAYHRVAECETNVKKSFFINGFCVKHLADCCKHTGAALMHFSTDYVFDGCKKKPYKENDCPQPVNVYGLSKLVGELFVRRALPEHFIIRISGVFGGTGSRQKGGNFITQILDKAQRGEDVSVVTDLKFSPTYTSDGACVLHDILRGGRHGTFHVTNAGECSWYEFAQTVFKITRVKARLKPLLHGRLGQNVERPANSVLENAHIKMLGIAPARHWRDALREYLRDGHADS